MPIRVIEVDIRDVDKIEMLDHCPGCSSDYTIVMAPRRECGPCTHKRLEASARPRITLPKWLFAVWAVISFGFLFGGWAWIARHVVSPRWREALFVFGVVSAGTFLAYITDQGIRRRG